MPGSLLRRAVCDGGRVRRAAVIVLVCAVAVAAPGCSAQLSRQDPGAAPTSAAVPPARTDVPDAAVLPAEQAVGDEAGVGSE